MARHQAGDKLLSQPKTLAFINLPSQAQDMLHYDITSTGIYI